MREDYLTKEELIKWVEEDVLKQDILLTAEILKVNLINVSNMINFNYEPETGTFIFIDKECPYNDYCFNARKKNIKILKNKIYVYLSKTIFFNSNTNYNFLILDNACDTIINKLKAILTI